MYCSEVSHQITPDPDSPFLKYRRPDLYAEIDKSRYVDQYLSGLTPGSHKQIVWICSKHTSCNMHIWESEIRTRVKGSGCPFCSGKSGSGKSCPCDSFMKNTLLASEFDQDLNQNLKPWEISQGSNIMIQWKCSIHKSCNEHIWFSTAHNRIGGGTGCPFCTTSGTKQTCLCDSFMNNPLLSLLANEFDFNHPDNIKINPYKLSYGSGTNVYWKCSTCSFSWFDTIHNRSRGIDCPYCSSQKTISKGEERCKLYLNHLNISSFSQIRLQYIPTRRYDFGFQLNDTFLIEFDGIQHFKYTQFFHKSFEEFRERQEIDKIKSLIPLILGYNILRISDDNPEHIERCINILIEIKKHDYYSTTPLLIVDDINKYYFLYNYLTKDLIKRICLERYHNEIISKFTNFEINIYCINTNRLHKKIFDLDEVIIFI